MQSTSTFGPNICGRSEDTFSAGEGAFFTNKDGPVRAIRSYLGANSGPFTQRDHIFYEQRQDITTFLRVHEIPGVMDLYDYSPAASGMYYYNDWNTEGLLVDGVRIATYAALVLWAGERLEVPPGSAPLVVTGILAAFTGVLLGKRFLHKVTMHWVQALTGTLLLLIAVLLGFGFI